jgi:hypothetical protein
MSTADARHHPQHALAALLALLIAAACALPATAQARRVPAPRLAFVRCSSVPYPCQGHAVVTRTGHLLVGASRMSRRAKVLFPVRPLGRRAGVRAVGGTFRTGTRIVVRVPGDAVSGLIRVVNPGNRRSNPARITVRRQPARRSGPFPTGEPSVFDGNGMWIWYVSKSQGGSIAAIAAQAKAHGIQTVFVKSADGGNVWSQFSAGTVAALKAAGLHVCGWQFVYGSDPVAEARAGAVAAQRGADCFAIDAEGSYEGRYAQAQRYMTALRAALGPDYPIGLTSFPYVDFHPSFPYSVFLAPGNATFNLPQDYWKTIGDPVDQSLAHTYTWNAPYEAGIYPLGQTYDGAPPSGIEAFRQLAAGYGARGLSWWDWQETTAAGWDAVGAPLSPMTPPPTPIGPTLHTGSRGDLVVWAQEHLNGAGQTVKVDGAFGSATASAVRAFQAASGLQQTGAVDTATWPVLLRATPVVPDWTSPGTTGTGTGTGTGSGSGAATAAAARAGSRAPSGPWSASLRARRDEIPPGPVR